MRFRYAGQLQREGPTRIPSRDGSFLEWPPTQPTFEVDDDDQRAIDALLQAHDHETGEALYAKVGA